MYEKSNNSHKFIENLLKMLHKSLRELKGFQQKICFDEDNEDSCTSMTRKTKVEFKQRIRNHLLRLDCIIKEARKIRKKNVIIELISNEEFLKFLMRNCLVFPKFIFNDFLLFFFSLDKATSYYDNFFEFVETFFDAWKNIKRQRLNAAHPFKTDHGPGEGYQMVFFNCVNSSTYFKNFENLLNVENRAFEILFEKKIKKKIMDQIIRNVNDPSKYKNVFGFFNDYMEGILAELGRRNNLIISSQFFSLFPELTVNKKNNVLCQAKGLLKMWRFFDNFFHFTAFHADFRGLKSTHPDFDIRTYFFSENRIFEQTLRVFHAFGNQQVKVEDKANLSDSERKILQIHLKNQTSLIKCSFAIMRLMSETQFDDDLKIGRLPTYNELWLDHMLTAHVDKNIRLDKPTNVIPNCLNGIIFSICIAWKSANSSISSQNAKKPSLEQADEADPGREKSADLDPKSEESEAHKKSPGSRHSQDDCRKGDDALPGEQLEYHQICEDFLGFIDKYDKDYYFERLKDYIQDNLEMIRLLSLENKNEDSRSRGTISICEGFKDWKYFNFLLGSTRILIEFYAELVTRVNPSKLFEFLHLLEPHRECVQNLLKIDLKSKSIFSNIQKRAWNSRSE